MKKTLVCIFAFAVYFFIFSQVQATGSVSLSNNKSSVYVDDTFSVSINLSGVSIATLTARINIDTQKVEYVSGPSNSNYSNGKIIYTWTDPNGGASPLTGGTIATFTFKAKSQGNANFSVSGDFFTPDELSANPSFSGTTVAVKNIEVDTGGNAGTGTETGGDTGTGTGGNTGTSTGGNTGTNTGGNAGTSTGGNAGTSTGGNAGTSTGGNAGTSTGGNAGTSTGGNAGTSAGGNTGTSSNTNNATENKSSNNNLNSLQLNVEGISPNFNKNITQYYITVSENVTNINVTANPEDSKSKVQVTGNNNIPVGASKIRISVTSESGKTKEYVINVTKTNNSELSNTNLENLAIENATLVPEFNPNVTDYTVEIYEDLDKLNILAVPQREAAKVIIEGNENLQFGDNVIKVTVFAEDGVSTKVYNIVAQKKEKVLETKEINEENVEENGEINDVDNVEDITDRVNENVKSNNVLIFIIIAILAILIIAVIVIIVKKKKKSNVGDKDKFL